MGRPNRNSQSSKTGSSTGMSKFNTEAYFNRGGVDPVLETQMVEFQVPTAGVRASIAGVPAFDGSEARLGLHYLRMPYFSRDVMHAMWRDMFSFFSSMQTGGDITMLDRFWHLRLIGHAGITSSTSYENVAKAHVNIRMNYRYAATHLCLRAIATLNLARKNGFGSLSESINPTLKFSVINSMFSKIANFPIDKRYLEACVAAMADLVAGDNEHGIFVSIPDWLPIGQAYVESVKGLETTGYWSQRTASHMLLGEYVAANKRYVEFDHLERGVGLTADPTGAGTWTNITGLSKRKGYFFDHWLEMLQAEVDMFYDNFVNNSVSDLNIANPGSKVADYYASCGDFNDRITFTEIVKYADGIKQLDLASYAAKNFKFFQEASPVLRFDADPSLLHAMTAEGLGICQWDKPTRDYVEAAADLDDMYEVPYLGLGIADGSDLNAFLNGTAAGVYGADSFAPLEYEAAYQTLIEDKMAMFTMNQHRYVDAANRGSYLKSAGDGNIVAYPSLTRRGKFFPMWTVTPFIDPNDRMMNGFFTLLDLKNSSPRLGTWEDVIKQVSGLAAFECGWTDGTSTGSIQAARGASSWVSITTDHSKGVVEEFADIAGSALLYLGDAPNIPPALHLLRADITFMAFGAADLTGNLNWVPAAPYRKIPVDFSLNPATAGDTPTYTPQLTGITAAFNTLKDGIDVTAFDVAMTNTIASQNPKAVPAMIYAPMFVPSMRRPICEYTDHGIYMWMKHFFDYEKKPAFSVPGFTSSGTTASLPRGVDQQKDKQAAKEADRAKRFSEKPDFARPSNASKPKLKWAKKASAVDPSGTVGEPSMDPTRPAKPSDL